MNTRPTEPLDTEERELAQRLARVGLPGEPSPALDARILAAAHDAVAKRSPQHARGRRRWPVAFGVAASLALAVGIAWQLRPLPQAPPAYEETASAAMLEPPASNMAMPEAAADDALAEPFPAKPASPAEADTGHTSSPPAGRKMQPTMSSARDDADGAAAATTESPPIVFDQLRPVDAQAAPAAAPVPPPPPAPPATTSASPEFTPAPTTPAPAAEQRARRESAMGTTSAQQRAVSGDATKIRSNEAKEDASTLDTITIEEGSEEGFDERPPSTADSPAVRQAWLQRIRELIASDEINAARDSLQEFKRRYPAVALPDDLRRFDQTTP